MVSFGFGIDLLVYDKSKANIDKDKVLGYLRYIEKNIKPVIIELNEDDNGDLSDKTHINYMYRKIYKTLSKEIDEFDSVSNRNNNICCRFWLDSIGVLLVKLRENREESNFTVATNDKVTKKDLEKYIEFGNSFLDTYIKNKMYGDYIIYVAIIDVIPKGVPTFILDPKQL